MLCTKKTFKRAMLLPLLALPLAGPSQANGRHLELNLDTPALERSCYFDGQRYSEGTVLEENGKRIRCTVLDGVTENGTLGWLPEDDQRPPQIEQTQNSSSRVVEIRK